MILGGWPTKGRCGWSEVEVRLPEKPMIFEGAAMGGREMKRVFFVMGEEREDGGFLNPPSKALKDLDHPN
ncbi:hypothetical protein QJS10_CPB13g00944 [Acorus calamus]|uniref:Uncharacterized protein n=1 Tax=Acorus calamus TaxID=4465 RepID=A0AAV9DIW6_ACOCL|nr:hypothetical protein QJS10_CPB13g00944 [Acorus calamus]